MFMKKNNEAQFELMRRTALEAADTIDWLRVENEQLRLRGRKLVDAVETSDGTITAAWRVTDAIAGWREYDMAVSND